MVVLSSRDAIPGGVLADHLIATGDARNVVNDGFNLIVLDVRHEQAAVKILDETGELLWTVETSGCISSCIEPEPMLRRLRPLVSANLATRPLPWGVAPESSLKS